MTLDTGEDEDAEGTVCWDLLLQSDEVGIRQTGDRAGGECAPRGQAHAGNIEQRRLSGVAGIPVENVGLVRNTIATGELARGLEGLDELVFFFPTGSNGGVAGLTNLTSGGTALGEKRGVSGVEVEQSLSDFLALALVGAQDRAVGQSGFHGVDLPGHVQRIVERSVHSLTSFRLEGVSIL